MARERTREEVLKTIARYSKISQDELLAAGSIDDLMEPVLVIEVIFELEERFGMEVDDNEVLKVETVEDLIACVLQQLDAAA